MSQGSRPSKRRFPSSAGSSGDPSNRSSSCHTVRQGARMQRRPGHLPCQAAKAGRSRQGVRVGGGGGWGVRQDLGSKLQDPRCRSQQLALCGRNHRRGAPGRSAPRPCARRQLPGRRQRARVCRSPGASPRRRFPRTGRPGGPGSSLRPGRDLRSPAARQEPQPQGLRARPPPARPGEPGPARGTWAARGPPGAETQAHKDASAPEPWGPGADRGGDPGWGFYDPIFNPLGGRSGELLWGAGPRPRR